MTFYWEEPCKPNGIITGYIVSYNITKRTANIHCPVEEHYMSFNVTGIVTFHKNITDLYNRVECKNILYAHNRSKY
jgi:hypothetical protein